MFELPKKPSIKQAKQKADTRKFAVLPIRAANDKRLTRRDLVNLIALCSYCSQGGFTTVALSTLGRFRGISAPAISQGLKRLRDFGYMEQVRGGYTGLRGSLKRVIYDETITIRDAVRISQSSIEEEVMKHSNVKRLSKSVKSSKVNDSTLSYDDGVLVVKDFIKSESDLLKLERLISQGITRSQLLEAFKAFGEGVCG